MSRLARSRKRTDLNPTSAGTLPLPHEKDETPEERHDVRTAPQPEVAQASRDLRAGLVDTDNYTRAREIAKPALTRRR